MTGRIIRPDKFFVYPINFSFNLNRIYYFEKIESFIEVLTIKNEFGIRERLKLVEAYEG